MDPLIRYAQLAPLRMRLSETPVGRAAVAGAATSGVRREPQPDALRIEIEKQVRAEFSAQAQQQYASEHERARADGYADGIAEARADATGELDRAREQLQTQVSGALSAIERAHEAALSKLEAGVGEVAFAAVCRLVGRNATSHAFVLGLVEHTCAEVRADRIATARLHPRDIHTLRDLLLDGELRVQSLGLKLIPDESLELGGCVLEAASGRYDGGLENQLRRLHSVLVGKE